ncbi:NAD(P)-dependent nickel-iron dehydrogenase diaphorase component subunit HoxU [Longilinea arvoryzae]|uniref:NAD(P)-dependent nickel-iron dehydrogenase diaphorase component subunit HoxU n=1 Tax=Longilinea arvoryzae TaxID=360412 RepID=A0A0S7B9V8_9CHLR|nr:bidirectional hydrogenase complex protein HoxU [Longilinea arvoryzae]GAP14319.1 NAD(P)-dependent nickel-iron dehydrogenase diaphorase component subunit HoxU [Longilinea arvoryzae]
MTPNSVVKTLTIDGKQVSGAAGETVLDVARQNGVDIPTLCNLDGLTPTGQCRLCMVETKGSPRLLPACVLQIEEGMEIVTDSPRLLKYRQMIIELIFSERNHVCAVCVSNGHCDLQAMAQRLGVTHIRYDYLHPLFQVDGSNLKYEVDHNRCILCGRCVRVCDEIEGAHTRDIRNRGLNTLVITDFDEPWGDSMTCTNCGKCVQVCPTGALAEKGKSVAEMAKRRQFLPYLVMRREGKKA